MASPISDYSNTIGGQINPTNSLNQAPTLGALPKPYSGPALYQSNGLLTNNNGIVAPATSTPKPTSVVSTTPATNQVSQIRTTVNNQNSVNTAASNIPTGYNDVRDPITGLLLNPPGALYDRNTGKLLNPPTTPTNSPSAEETIANSPDDGMQEAYNIQTGQRQDQPIGSLQSGFSSQNPQTRTDVSGTANVGNGIQYKEFNDGTYGRFDASGNYSPATAQAFSDAQQQQSISDKITQINNGTFQLPANQQALLDGISSKYGALIQQQQTLNANTTGATTLAENMYGLGNSLTGKGVVAKTVQDGLDKVQTLQSNLASDLATMQDSLEKDDMAQLKDSYDSYQSNQAGIQNEIDKVTAYVQSEQDKQQAVIDSKNMGYALQQSAKYGDAGILPTDTPQEVDQKKQQNSSVYKYELGNKSGTVDQNALDGMLSSYKKTGVVPSFGFGATGTPMRTAFWAAVNGTTGLVDQATLDKSALAGSTKALTTQQNQYSAAQTSVDQMKKSLDIASGYENKLDNTGSPIVQKYINALKTGVFGSGDVSALHAAITTAANEYARILSGASASIGGTSVSSSKQAEDLLNTAMSKGQFDSVLSVMKQDANARIEAQKNTINSIQQDILDIGSSNASSGSADTGGFAESW